jgi:glycosyl transferase family 87
MRSIRQLLTWKPEVDGRLLLTIAVATYLGIIAAGRLEWGVDLWPYLGVPPGPSLFFDARNVTAAWESERLGYDPLYESPRDPRHRPLMYLRPWLLLGVLGLDQSHTVILSTFLIAAMFVSFGLLVGRVTAGTGIVLAFAVCSPAVMLAVERGNMDIALFSIVTVSILLWRVLPGPARVVSPIFVLIGATAKIYPVFALPAFVISGSRSAARAALLCVAAFGIYCAYSLRDIAHVAEIATQGEQFSYGARILPAHLYHQLGIERWSGPPILKQAIALVPLAAISAAIAIRVHRHFSPRRDEATVASASLLALHVGALIYLGTFAIANNFDYRLVFLLQTFPQLIEWACRPEHRLSGLALATLVAIVVLLWVGSLSQWLNLWDELASWAVAGLLAAVVAATVPGLDSVRKSVFGRRASANSTT